MSHPMVKAYAAAREGLNKKYDEVFRHSADSETYLVDFLKNLQKKGK